MKISEVFLSKLGAINERLAPGGTANKILLSAFQQAGLSFDEENFPSIVIDGSVYHVGLLLSEPGTYRMDQEVTSTVFGNQIAAITVHPQTIVDALAVVQDIDEKPRQQQTAILGMTIYTLAIDAIVSATMNDPTVQLVELRDQILANVSNALISSQNTETSG